MKYLLIAIATFFIVIFTAFTVNTKVTKQQPKIDRLKSEGCFDGQMNFLGSDICNQIMTGKLTGQLFAQSTGCRNIFICSGSRCEWVWICE